MPASPQSERMTGAGSPLSALESEHCAECGMAFLCHSEGDLAYCNEVLTLRADLLAEQEARREAVGVIIELSGVRTELAHYKAEWWRLREGFKGMALSSTTLPLGMTSDEGHSIDIWKHRYFSLIEVAARYAAPDAFSPPPETER